MEYNLTKQTSAYCEIFLDTVNEQIVDADITLPDYCPDIEKILKCTLVPKIYNRQIAGGQLSIEGEAVIRILYCDAVRHSLRSYEHTTPFTATFNLKSTPMQYVVNTFAKCEYINCRALSPRKLSVHSAFSLYAKVFSKSQKDFYNFEQECDLQTKQTEIAVSDLCGICQEQFSFAQEIMVSSKPEIAALLSYETATNILELKSINNKLMLSAQLVLKVMYLSDLETSEVEHFTTTFDINRIIDCDGVCEDSVNIPTLEILSSDISVRNDSLSSESALSLDVKLCFSDFSYNTNNMKVISDAYSIKFKTDHQFTPYSFENNHSFETYTNLVNSTLDFDNIKISKILQVYSEGVTASAVISDEKLEVQGKSNICIMLQDENGSACYVERCVDFTFSPQIKRSFDKAVLKESFTKSLSFRLVDDSSIEVRLENLFSLILCDCVCDNYITAVEYGDEDLTKTQECSLIMYFADKGEDTWDIAKQYKTKQELLLSENSLDSEVLTESTMLLVVTE